ncbi:L-proline glycine betaine ABC transport system permease ProW [Dehalogenimonas sp. WBC-2]|nr:L-proline glycine betaine ABC transport system permease ProW [Dehalogenimonas sp. WBC-2]
MWPFDLYTIPLSQWIQDAVKWLGANLRDFFQALKVPLDFTLDHVQSLLEFTPPLIMLAIVFFIAWRTKGWLFALISVVALTFVGFLGMWQPTMVTLALIITSVVFCAIIGIPLGIVAASSRAAQSIMRPLLDAMQTTPAFVYLVPIVVLFGIGLVPGLIAIIIFALPPIIRLTDLGIRQVPKEIVEAGFSFGATGRQVLFSIQIPLAMPTILAGLNQTLMLALSMAVLVALIGASGLGEVVWVGMGRNNAGQAALGGIGIVVMAIILDRITQALGESRKTGRTSWFGQLKRFINAKFAKKTKPTP